MYYEPIRESIVKVRKAHQCLWCDESILVGETAQYRVYVSDGDFNTDYMHMECRAATFKVSGEIAQNLEEGIEPGMFFRGTPDLTPKYA